MQPYSKSDKLKTSKFGDESNISRIVDAFEKTKRLFHGSKDAFCSIQFGSTLEKDVVNDIKAGRLKINA